MSEVVTEKLKINEYVSTKIKTEINKIIPIFLFFVFLLEKFFLTKVTNRVQFRDN